MYDLRTHDKWKLRELATYYGVTPAIVRRCIERERKRRGVLNAEERLLEIRKIIEDKLPGGTSGGEAVARIYHLTRSEP